MNLVIMQGNLRRDIYKFLRGYQIYQNRHLCVLCILLKPRRCMYYMAIFRFSETFLRMHYKGKTAFYSWREAKESKILPSEKKFLSQGSYWNCSWRSIQKYFIMTSGQSYNLMWIPNHWTFISRLGFAPRTHN